MPRSKRSSAQRLQLYAAQAQLSRIRSHDKENAPNNPIGGFQEESQIILQKKQERGDLYRSKFHQEQRKVLRAKANLQKAHVQGTQTQTELDRITKELTAEKLAHKCTSGQLAEKTEMAVALKMKLSKKMDAHRKKVARLTSGRKHAIEQAVMEARTVHLKKGRMVSDNTRETIRELVASGVPVEQVGPTIDIVSRGLGVETKGSFSTRTSGQVVGEGGVASRWQLAHEISSTDRELTSKCQGTPS
jgi:hypothetical protein